MQRAWLFGFQRLHILGFVHVSIVEKTSPFKHTFFEPLTNEYYSSIFYSCKPCTLYSG